MIWLPQSFIFEKPETPRERPDDVVPPYAEFGVATNFSFLRGASRPEELIVAAHLLGLAGIGIADRNSVAGLVRAHDTLAHEELKGTKLRLLHGVRLVFQDGTPEICAWPQDRDSYGRLTRLLTVGNMRGAKAECLLTFDDLASHAEGQLFVLAPQPRLAPRMRDTLRSLIDLAPDRVWLAASMSHRGDDRKRLARVKSLASETGAKLIATNDVLYHAPDRRPLQDVLTCIREHVTIREAGRLLEVNAERHLKSASEMARLFSDAPEALAETIRLLERVSFSLDQLEYDYPDEPVPPGETPQSWLEHLTWEGAARRYPGGVPPRVAETLRRELALIETLDYAPYFLTVHDIVDFAHKQKILCQGRGSAANSAVCYVLGITAVDPAEMDLLFERFVSQERREPPDIDVDFEHERREEVMQYIYRRYGRMRAGIAATVISYRPRSAIRDVGKALGLTEDVTAALANTVWGSWGDGVSQTQIREAGLDPESPIIRQAASLAAELMGFPRHLSQHVGGYVLTKRRLDETVPIGNAAMEDRTFIEWDKDDLDSLKIMKIDVLALGMLTCIRKCFDLIALHGGQLLELATIPPDDSAVYGMLSRGDSLGVFQVESRAQMNMLPRMKPSCFYDLVIEVAIVRPGPIQGDMVHPYLKRRQGLEKVTFPSPAPEHGPPDELERVLGRTLGVPLFQEQAMKLAIEAAKFTPDEANALRRSMATFRHVGTIHTLKEKFVGRMIARGYDPDFAARCFKQIEGFGSYGFPESHAASFARLVYISSWLKCHHPAAFAAGLLNSQPMGFYAPAEIVRDAREHGVEARCIDVNLSDWDNTLDGNFSAALPGMLPSEETPPGPRIRSEAGSSGHPPLKGRDSATQGAEFVQHREHPSPGGEGGRPQGRPSGETCSNKNLIDASWPGASRPSTASSPQAKPWMPGTEAGHDVERRQSAIGSSDPALRLGFRQIDGFREEWAQSIMENRGEGYASVEDLKRRAALPKAVLRLLADADAFRSVGMDRRAALWAVRRLPDASDLPLFAAAGVPEPEETIAPLPEMPLPEHVVADYQTHRLSLKGHPVQFLREGFRRERILSCTEIAQTTDGKWERVAGVVLVRQRPGSAKGVVFMTLADETGITNAVIWPKVLERYRKEVMGARLVLIEGRIQKSPEGIVHLVASRLIDRTADLDTLSEDRFKAPLSRADEVVRPQADRRHPRKVRILPPSRDFH